MQLHPLTPGTLQSAIRLANQVFPRQPWRERASIALRLSLHCGPTVRLALRLCGIVDAHYWVAINDQGAVIGLTGLYRYRQDAADAQWLGWTCVAPAARGLGLGSRLVDHSIDRARRAGFRVLRLYTSTHPDEATAQVLYQRRGFRLMHEHQGTGAHHIRYLELVL
jgi:GNAT superfamily N-acetyltransferase